MQRVSGSAASQERAASRAVTTHPLFPPATRPAADRHRARPAALRRGRNSLSGRVVFAAPAPASLEGSVEIYYRLAKSNHEFTNSGVSLSLTQESWQLNKLKNNAVYEIVAYLILDNQQVFKSEIITAQVPTQDLNINLPVDWQKYLVGGNVSGVIKINGFMPEGSKVVIVEDVPTNSGLTSEGRQIGRASCRERV